MPTRAQSLLLLLLFAAIAGVQWMRSVPRSHRPVASSDVHDAAAALLTARIAASAVRAEPQPAATRAESGGGARDLDECSTCRGVVLDAGVLGQIRLHLRPEWCNLSHSYVMGVAAKKLATSSVYRLEPGFLIQGRMAATGVPQLRRTTKAAKVMERGEVRANDRSLHLSS